MAKFPSSSFTALVLTLASGVLGYAQSSSGTVRGSVLDPSGAAIAGASVEISNPVSHYQQTAKSNAQGTFQFANLPYNNYHLAVNAPGFQSTQQDVDVRSAAVAYGHKDYVASRRRNHQRDGGKLRGFGGDRFHDAHGRGSQPVRQVAARKQLVFLEFSGHAGVARSFGRFQWPLPRPGRSRVQLVFD